MSIATCNLLVPFFWRLRWFSARMLFVGKIPCVWSDGVLIRLVFQVRDSSFRSSRIGFHTGLPATVRLKSVWNLNPLTEIDALGV